MKNISAPLVDEHLLSIQDLNEAATDEFFYTRLRARLDSHSTATGWRLPFRPSWILGLLILLLAVNGIILSKQFSSNKSANGSASPLQTFAESYDQSVSAY